ncbi:MAG: pyridoxal 5'-phosphate synthase glutaminase subunit PdxT [Dehalococcoidia bacterium]|jgi:5'-phosphate synthase pdxT subunit
MRIGVLAIQGAFAEHIHALSRLNIEAVPVRLPADLDGLDALIIPGGESTTISTLLSEYHLAESLQQRAAEGFPLFGTCSGLILLAKNVTNRKINSLGVMDIEVERNAFGRQVDSFETDLTVSHFGDGTFHGIFIRAPIITKVEPAVEILSSLNGNAVAVRQGRNLACSFHPELTDDLRFHRYFIDLITGDVLAEGSD